MNNPIILRIHASKPCNVLYRKGVTLNPEDFKIRSITLLILMLGLAAENAIRPFVLGRKNWLFSATSRGAHASAALYSVFESAKANGHEPYWYLRFLFQGLISARTAEKYAALLPQNVDPKALRPA